MQRGRPKTKPLTVFKKLEPKFKVRLDRNTTVYVRSLDIVKEVWKPLYPELRVTKLTEAIRTAMPDTYSKTGSKRATAKKDKKRKSISKPRHT